MQKNLTNNINFPVFLLTTVLALLAAAMMIFPRQSYDSALLGLELWWEVVTPALLPFFFISEILTELDVSRFLGRAMSPLMAPLFALPGAAALPVALGFCSGFPSGAAITAALRRKGEISREEGSRLICFTNNAGPLYISVAIAGALLNCPRAAVILAVAQYGGNILIGVALGMISRFRGYRPLNAAVTDSPTLPDALPGRIIKAAASRAAANMTSIGCLMIFFSVFTGFISGITGDGSPLFAGMFRGFWEMSLGIHGLAESSLPLTDIIPAVAAVLGFGGISVHTQVLAMIGDTDIRFLPFFLCRFLHAGLAWLIAKLLCLFISLPVLSAAQPGLMIPPAHRILLHSLTAALVCCAVLFSVALAALLLTPVLRKRRPPDRRS